MTLTLREVSVAYGKHWALQGVDLEVDDGEILALLGPNGSGKTTLLRTITAALSPHNGTVRWDGEAISALPPAHLAQRLAAVEQAPSVGFDFTVRELVEWGRIPHRRRLRPWRARDERAVQAALAATDMAAFEARSIQELSGGERQRAFLAMALAQEPEVLVLDEPTAHLDLRHQVAILELLRSFSARDGMTVVAACHDLNLAARYADRVAVLSEGRLIAAGPPERTLTEELVRAVWAIEVRIHRDADGLWIRPRAGRPTASSESAAAGPR